MIREMIVLANSDRLLLILRYLQENSDAGKQVSTRDIRNMLSEHGIEAHISTLRGDIAALRRAGFDIASEETNGLVTQYSYVDRPWDLPELQILIDAVNACQFITPAKTRMLIEKLRSMAGPSLREKLVPGIQIEDRVKAPNEMILYVVQDVMRAIRLKKQITFRYFAYDTDFSRVMKHGGLVYQVSPYAMIWQDDRYYAVGFSERHGKIAKFRLDRMEQPKILRKGAVPVPDEFELGAYATKVIHMYDPGVEEEVTLRCRRGMMDHLVDRFGTNVKVINMDDRCFDAKVTVNVSRTFYGWLFQFAGEMNLIAPESACREYAELLQEGLDDVLSGE